jgi:hypothetical protein
VHCTRGERPVKEVMADVDDWVELYGDLVGGIFVDESPNHFDEVRPPQAGLGGGAPLRTKQKRGTGGVPRPANPKGSGAPPAAAGRLRR